MSRIETLHVYDGQLARWLSGPAGELLDGRDVIVLDDAESFAEALPEVEALFGYAMPADHWHRATSLRMIQIPGAGVDSLLPAPDLPEAVQVCNASGSHEPEMPEFVMAMLHALLYRVPQLVDQQRAKTWRIVRPDRALTGSTLCVVGLGAIGQSVARRAAALGMRVVGVRHSGRPIDGVDHVVTPDRRLDVLDGADAVVVITPLTEATRGLIGEAELAVLADGAVVVDVSRGGVTDMHALVAALGSGKVGGAAVDVFETEPLPDDSPLWEVPGLFVTPHTAGWSSDYVTRIVKITVENLEAIEAGRTPPTLIDRTLGY